LITFPAGIVIKTANEFKDKTTAINWLWQTDLTYLNTILDDYSRYIISWKLCTNMRTQDVTDTLDLVQKDQTKVTLKTTLAISHNTINQMS
jgi:hypothetical protein